VPEPLLPWQPVDRFGGWMMALIITTIAGVLRFWNIAGPQGTVFDEIYYATESQEILHFGYENNPGFGLIVHPPLAKQLIAIGDWLFGGWSQQFGWRFSSALVGTLSVLITIRVARRMFRSDLMAALAGLLLTVEGVSFVMSRLALLDIFLQFFAILAFAAMVLDRDQLRSRLARLLADGADLTDGPPRLGPRPWRLVAGVSLGLMCAVKWSGLSFWVLFAILSVAWDRGAFRSAGVRYPWSAVWRRSLPGAIGSYGVASAAAYLLTWVGWINGENSWNRHWADAHKATGLETLMPGWLRSMINFHRVAYNFHVGLTAHHPYGSAAVVVADPRPADELPSTALRTVRTTTPAAVWPGAPARSCSSAPHSCGGRSRRSCSGSAGSRRDPRLAGRVCSSPLSPGGSCIEEHQPHDVLLHDAVDAVLVLDDLALGTLSATRPSD
jgi:4-amino-4-deoxy-L-arabinose transferase-like glycosyltransferase